jgi:Zn-dependent protease
VFDLILSFALAVIPTVLAITLHELAHGYAALALGDDTARKAGRLSLNPLAHVDRVGTILLPGFLLVAQLATLGRVVFMFGWAKPVPVSAWKFRNPRRGMMVVAAAGPAMNFFLAWVGALGFYLTPLLNGYGRGRAQDFLFYFILFNLVLGLFNLVPIPPLDGGRILVGVLPEAAARVWARLERAGLVIVLLVVFLLPALLRNSGIHFDPFGDLIGNVAFSAFRLLIRLAGNPADGLHMLGEGNGA